MNDDQFREYQRMSREAEKEWARIKEIELDSLFLSKTRKLLVDVPQVEGAASFDYERELNRRLLLALERNLSK